MVIELHHELHVLLCSLFWNCPKVFWLLSRDDWDVLQQCYSSVTMTSAFVPVSGRHCFSFVSLGQFKPPMRMQPLVSSLRLEQYCSSPEADPGQIYPNSFFSVFMEVFLLIQCSSFFQGIGKIQQSKSLHLLVRVTALVMEVYK